MKYVTDCGWWLPEEDTHFEYYMRRARQEAPRGRYGYQQEKYAMALRHTTCRMVAIDVGAHVGTWSWSMAHDFVDVLAFEPRIAHVQCWHRNMRNAPANAVLVRAAVGAAPRATVRLASAGANSGMMQLSDGGAEIAPMVTLDDHAPALRVGLIKIDVEGSELGVLRGGAALIAHDRPTICIEEHVQNGPAVALLVSWGYRIAERKGSDYVMVPA